jgi:branched-chain amino acid transport system ATP-binding protein
VLFDVSVEIPEGEVVALLGRNGAGKTTTIRSIMGLTHPRTARVLFKEENIAGLPPYTMVMEVMKIITELKEKGETILLVEQNSTLALRVSQRAYILENGHVVYAGAAEELARNVEVKRRYLGI